jgi:hypothetical protein
VFAALDQVAPPQLLAGLAVLVGIVTATWQRIRSAAPECFPDLFAWPMAASLLCAPIPVIPSLAAAISVVGSTLLIIIWTVSIIPVYVQWHLRTLGHPWGALPGWVMLLEYGYGCVAIAGAMSQT